MRALKLEGRIRADRTLAVQLPDDVDEGMAEVSVLLPEPARAKPRGSGLLSFLDSLPPGRRSKSEIDESLAKERNSWDRLSPVCISTPVCSSSWSRELGPFVPTPRVC